MITNVVCSFTNGTFNTFYNSSSAGIFYYIYIVIRFYNISIQFCLLIQIYCLMIPIYKYCRNRNLQYILVNSPSYWITSEQYYKSYHTCHALNLIIKIKQGYLYQLKRTLKCNIIKHYFWFLVLR